MDVVLFYMQILLLMYDVVKVYFGLRNVFDSLKLASLGTHVAKLLDAILNGLVQDCLDVVDDGF